MRLERIRLHNWQCYYGSGANAADVKLAGKPAGLKNAIIYGQNSAGKTAIWEAVRFAFYGQVPKRMSRLVSKANKPIVADTTAKEPLLNISAYLRQEYNLGVEVWFDQKGSLYHVHRTAEVRRGVAKPTTNYDYEIKIVVRNETLGTFEQDAEEFLRTILPEALAQFFMFDGERLEEYRELIASVEKVELRRYIEAVLGLPVLTDGIGDFQDLIAEVDKDIRRFKRGQSKDDQLKEELVSLEKGLEDYTKARQLLQDKKDETEQKLNEVRAWLTDNDQGKQALERAEQSEKRIQAIDKEIEAERDKVKKILPEAWRRLMAPMLDTAIEAVEGELDRQERAGVEQVRLWDEIKKLERQIVGAPCGECGKPQASPNEDALQRLTAKKREASERADALQASKMIPDPGELRQQVKSLRKMRLDGNLQSLIDIENSIHKKAQERREVDDTRKKAAELIKETRTQVAEKLAERDGYLKEIGRHEAALSPYDKSIKDLELHIKVKTQQIKPEGHKTVEHVKAEKKQGFLNALLAVWTKVLEEHRERMRASVETSASATFMKCSNSARSYEGLEIRPDFTIVLKGKDGTANLGSPGQWALIAYSMLDALTDCSGIEFPMVIDTPGRSIDDDHLEKVIGHLMESDKQVILLPEGKELAPDNGDRLYGHRCAATYQLKKNQQEHTSLKLRIDHLRKAK